MPSLKLSVLNSILFKKRNISVLHSRSDFLLDDARGLKLKSGEKGRGFAFVKRFAEILFGNKKGKRRSNNLTKGCWKG